MGERAHNTVAETIAIALDLGPNAQRILLEVAKRLEIGKAHGDFTKPLDLKEEQSAELLDFVVYRIAETLGMCGSK